MFSCCAPVDTTHIEACKEKYHGTKIIVDSPGNSVTSKVFLYGIAFFSLGTGVAGCVFLATGTVAAGAYAMIGAGFFVLILDAGVICLVCRAQRKAIAELNAYLEKNPKLTIAIGYQDGFPTGGFVSKEYNIRVTKTNPGSNQFILHFSKKSSEQLEIEADIARVQGIVGQNFSLSQVRYFNDDTPLIDLTDDKVVTVQASRKQDLIGGRIFEEEDIYLHGSRVLFSCNLNERLVFSAAAHTDFVVVRQAQTVGIIYTITEYLTNGEQPKQWLVDARKGIRLIQRGGSLEFGPEKVFVVDEALPGNFDALEEGTQFSSLTDGPLTTALIKF